MPLLKLSIQNHTDGSRSLHGALIKQLLDFLAPKVVACGPIFDLRMLVRVPRSQSIARPFGSRSSAAQSPRLYAAAASTAIAVSIDWILPSPAVLVPSSVTKLLLT